VVTSKWIYKSKHVVVGSFKKYKAKGFSQTKGIVYDETLDPGNPIDFHLYYHP
jgi:hypothetical protein